MITLAEQIVCAKRELELRRRVYPRWVASARMTQAKADHEIAAMEAIIGTLRAVEARERLL